MQAWVVVTGNGYPAGIRATEQDVLDAAHKLVTRHILDDDEHSPGDVGLVRWKIDRGSDVLQIRFYIAQPFPYMIIEAFLFDSTSELKS